MTINDFLKVNGQLSVDGKAYKYDGTFHVPWPTAAEFLSSTPAQLRHIGQIAFVLNAGVQEIWYFDNGIADSDFKKFIGPSAPEFSVLFFDNASDLPTTGSTDKLYVIKTPKALKIWDGTSYVNAGNPGPIGPIGPAGATGPIGPVGPIGPAGDSAYQVWLDEGNTGTEADFLYSLIGPTGPAGSDGVGVPAGGTSGQVLKKNSSTDYDTSWQNESGGGGGGDMTKSVYDPAGKNADAFDWNNFTNKPTIPPAQVNSDWSAVGGVAEILNKPTIPTIDPNTTIQGNTFNGADQLVKFGSDGKYPPGDGSQITGLPTEIIWLTDESFRPTVGVTDKAYVSKATGIIYRYDTVSGSYKIIGGGEGTPYMTATGTNTYIVTNTSAVTAYPKAVYMAFQNANTGASTIKIDGLTTLPLKVSGGDMPPNTVLAGAVKLLTLSSDSSHYQLQAGNIEVPAVPTGEKVLTKKSDGIHADYDVISATAGTATTGAYLSSLNWSTGSAATTGLEGEVRRYGGWKYECYADGNWKRYPDTLVYQDFILGTIDDSGGKKTSVQMSTAYPDAIAPQIVLGALGMYQYFGAISGWFYFENKI